MKLNKELIFLRTKKESVDTYCLQSNNTHKPQPPPKQSEIKTNNKKVLITKNFNSKLPDNILN